MNTSGIDLILRSIDLAFDRRKLALALAGIAVSAIGSGFFAWIGSQLGDNVALASIFLLIGLIFAWATISLFAGAITRLSYGDLAGWPARKALDAVQDAFQRLPSLLFAPLLLGIAWIGVILAQWLLMLLGRIPYLGELLVAVLFLPAVLLNTLMLVILLAGIWLVFPVAIGENAGVSQTLRRVVDVTRRAPGRILTYMGITLLLSLLVTAVLAALVLVAYSLTLTLTVTGMSPLRAMQMGLGNILNVFIPLLGPAGSLVGLFGSGRLLGGSVPVTMDIAGALLSLETLVLLLGSAWAVPWVFSLTASCAVHQLVAGTAPAQAAPAPQPAAWSPPVQPPTYIPPRPESFPPPVLPPQPVRPTYPPPAQPYVPTQVITPPPPISPSPVAPPQPRLCRSCGRPLANPNSRFCQVCGAKQ